MDIRSFLKLILRFKWVLILVPILVMCVTYYFVQNLPKQYNSEVRISTGLLDPSKKILNDQNVDFFKISQQFSNIMEKMKMKKIINILSYKLILHDLEQPKNAFRIYSKTVDSLSKDEKQKIINLFKDKLLNRAILTLADNKGKYKLLDIVESMGYSEYLLSKTLDISHTDNSDYITVNYVSENPDLSAYVVNTLAAEFISNYSSEVNFNQNNSIVLLDSLLKTKEQIMNKKNESLASFKRQKGVLNLNEQSAIVYGQISEYEAQRTQALKEIQSNRGALRVIEGKIRGNDPDLAGSNRADNREIINLKRQLEVANSNLIDGNFKPADQKKVDSLNRILTSKSNQNSDENVVDPRASKQSLIQQKLTLEVALQQALSSISSLDKQLSVLRSRYSVMVPYDADIQNYERDADLATKDYMAALDQYNNTKTEQNMGLKLQVDQVGLPGLPEPSKKMLYLGGSGVGSFLLVVIFIFILFLLDGSINNSAQLASATKIPVLGNLNFLSGPETSIRSVWNHAEGENEFGIYKNLLRSLRFEINNRMARDNNKILGITSLTSLEGKTTIAYNLAYSFAMVGKKVLLIGEEPKPVGDVNSKSITTSQNFEAFLVKKEIVAEDLITILNKNAANASILEMQNERNLKAGFEILKLQFDIIIIDINSLRDTNIAKEWLSFTEVNVGVFAAGKSITDQDRAYIDLLKKSNGFLGWILNKIKLTEVKINQYSN
jgi:succinoglycan biosynthesis transport protein ExoP